METSSYNLIGFNDSFSENEEKIISEYFSKNRRNANNIQRKSILKYCYDLFNEELLFSDKQVYTSQFHSKFTGLNYIVVKMSNDIALFEVS